MRASLELPNSRVLIEAALTGLVAVNEVLIQTGVVPPSPLDAGVRYKREGSGLEDWNNAYKVTKLGWGDCEDLAAWECAGIRLDGDDGAHCIIVPTGPRTWHCVVVLSNGEIIDVCPELGMHPSKAGTHAPISTEGVGALEWYQAPRANEYIGAGVATAVTAAPRRPAWGKRTLKMKSTALSQRALQASPSSAMMRTTPTTTDPNQMPPGTMPTSSPPGSSAPSAEQVPMPMMEDEEYDEEMEDDEIDEDGAA